MKIITWNCKMAYRKKAKLILGYLPDLVVVPECESFREATGKHLWFGDNRKKGIGIFSYSDFEIELHEAYNPAFKYVIPLEVKGPFEFNLFAVWAMNDLKDLRKRYIGQVYSAIDYYKNLLIIQQSLLETSTGMPFGIRVQVIHYMGISATQ